MTRARLLCLTCRLLGAASWGALICWALAVLGVGTVLAVLLGVANGAVLYWGME